MKTLRKFQQETIDKVLCRIDEGLKSGLICYATGLGKTLTAVKLLQKPCFNRILWCTHEEGLVNQSALAILKEEFEDDYPDMFTDIEEHGGIIDYLKFVKKQRFTLLDKPYYRLLQNHLGIVKAENFDISGKITVASIQTLYRRINGKNAIPSDWFDLVIMDEAHLAMSKSFSTVLNHFTPKFRLGLTATPERLDGLSLLNLFDEIVDQKDIKFGIDNNFLCMLDAERIQTEIDLSKVGKVGGDFNTGQLEKIINTPARNNFIVDKYLQYAKDRKFLAFCVDVQHAIDLCTVFNNRGINTTYVVGDEKLCPNRRERVEGVRNGVWTGATNVLVLTAGTDIPNISCIIAARPTQSKTIFLQSVGRGTRLKTEANPFKDCIILDIVDNTSKHNLVNTYTLEKDVPHEDKVFINKEKKDKLIEAREKREYKIKHKLEQDEKVNLFEIKTVKRNYDYHKPISEKQKELLIEWGDYVEGNDYTQGQFDKFFDEKPLDAKKIAELKSWNFNVTGKETIADYLGSKLDHEARMHKAKTSINGKTPIPHAHLMRR